MSIQEAQPNPVCCCAHRIQEYSVRLTGIAAELRCRWAEGVIADGGVSGHKVSTARPNPGEDNDKRGARAEVHPSDDERILHGRDEMDRLSLVLGGGAEAPNSARS